MGRPQISSKGFQLSARVEVTFNHLDSHRSRRNSDLYVDQRRQAFAKLEREIEVTSVAQLGSSFFVTKFQDQVTSATVESLEPSNARNALSEFDFTF